MGNDNRWLKARKRHQILIAKIQRIAGGSLIAALIVGPLIYFSVVAMPLEMREGGQGEQDKAATPEIGIDAVATPEVRISSTPIPLPQEDPKEAKILARSKTKDLKLEPETNKFESKDSETTESSGGDLSIKEETKFESFFEKQDVQIKKIKIGKDLPQVDTSYDPLLDPSLDPSALINVIPEPTTDELNKNRENEILIIEDLMLENGPSEINKKDDATKAADKALQQYLRSEFKSANFRIFDNTSILDKNKKPYQFVLSNTKQNNGKWYVTYQQYANGLPVFDGDIKLIFTDEKKLLTISDNIKRDLPDESEFKIGKAVVTQSVKEVFEWDDSIDEIAFIDKGYFEGQPAYRANTNAHNPLGDWEIFVDGVEGDVESMTADIRLQDLPSTPQIDYSPTPEPSTGGTEEPQIEILDNLFSQILGTIYPQTPDDTLTTEPLSSAYTYINETRNETDEQGYFENESMAWYSTFLDGPNVTVHDDSATSNMEIVNETPEAPFTWDENSASLAAINAFYHTNKIHDYFANNLNYEIDKNIPLTVNSNLVDAYIDGCGAWFNNTEKTIEMGRGGTASCPGELNYALGSDMVYHEYAHFIVEDITHLPNILGAESAAMGEGLADYFAATLNDDPMWGDVISPARRRNLENTLNYQNDMNGESHHDGMILSGALWDLREEIGAEATDQLVFNTLFQDRYHYETFMYGMIIEDDDNGDFSDGTPHLAEIITAFDNHGIGPGIANFNGLPLTPEAWAELLGEEMPEGEEENILGTFSWDSGAGCHLTNVGTNLYDLDIYNGSCRWWGTPSTYQIRDITVYSGTSCGTLYIGNVSYATNFTATGNIDVDDGCAMYVGTGNPYSTYLGASTLDVREGSTFDVFYNSTTSNTVAISGNMIAYSPSNITFHDDATSSAGTLIVYGSGLVQVGDWNPGLPPIVPGYSETGRLDVNGTAYLRNGGDITVYNTTSRLDTNAIENGDGSYSGGTLTNHGLLYNWGNANLYDSSASIVNDYKFYSQGTFTIAGGGNTTNSTSSSFYDFQVDGAFSITQGKFTNSGYLDVGGTTTLTGTSSELEINTGSNIELLGTTTLNSGAYIDLNGGTTSVPIFNINNASYIDQDGGTINASGVVSLNGTSYLDKDGGDFNANTHLTLASTATTAIDQAGSSGSFYVNDNFNINSTTQIYNHTGRTMTIGDDIWCSGSYTLTNDGTIEVGTQATWGDYHTFDAYNGTTITNNGTITVSPTVTDNNATVPNETYAHTRIGPGSTLTNNGTLTTDSMYCGTSTGTSLATCTNSATGDFNVNSHMYMYSGTLGIADGGDFDVIGNLTMEGVTGGVSVFLNYDNSVSVSGDVYANGFASIGNNATGDLDFWGSLTMADSGNDTNFVGNYGNLSIGTTAGEALIMENTNCTYVNYPGATTTVYDDVLLGNTTQSEAAILNQGTFNIVGSTSNRLEMAAGTVVGNISSNGASATFNVDSAGTNAADGVIFIYDSAIISNTGYDGSTDYDAFFNAHRIFNGQEGTNDGGTINNDPLGDFNVTQTGTTDAAITMYRGDIYHDDGATDFDVDGLIVMKGTPTDEAVFTANEAGSSDSIYIYENAHFTLDGLTSGITWTNTSYSAIYDMWNGTSAEEGYLEITEDDTYSSPAGYMLLGDLNNVTSPDYRGGYVTNDGTLSTKYITLYDTALVTNNGTVDADIVNVQSASTGTIDGTNTRKFDNYGTTSATDAIIIEGDGSTFNNHAGATLEHTNNVTTFPYDLWVADSGVLGNGASPDGGITPGGIISIAKKTEVSTEGKIDNYYNFTTETLKNGDVTSTLNGGLIQNGNSQYIPAGEDGYWVFAWGTFNVTSTDPQAAMMYAGDGRTDGGKFWNYHGELNVAGGLEMEGYNATYDSIFINRYEPENTTVSIVNIDDTLFLNDYSTYNNSGDTNTEKLQIAASSGGVGSHMLNETNISESIIYVMDTSDTATIIYDGGTLENNGFGTGNGLGNSGFSSAGRVNVMSGGSIISDTYSSFYFDQGLKTDGTVEIEDNVNAQENTTSGHAIAVTDGTTTFGLPTNTGNAGIISGDVYISGGDQGVGNYNFTSYDWMYIYDGNFITTDADTKSRLEDSHTGGDCRTYVHGDLSILSDAEMTVNCTSSDPDETDTLELDALYVFSGSPGGLTEIKDGGTLILNTNMETETMVVGDGATGSGVVTHDVADNTWDSNTTFVLKVTDTLTINSNGSLDVSGKSSIRQTAPTQIGPPHLDDEGRGGTYGGRGHYDYNDGSNDAPFGNVTEWLVDFGRIGVGSQSCVFYGLMKVCPGAAGGGIMNIIVGEDYEDDGFMDSGVTILNSGGKIWANGADYPDGAGSGGSINLKTRTLEGLGSILSVGGYSTSGLYDKTAGGGGRIYIEYYEKDNYSGPVGAYGGRNTDGDQAGTGTVFYKWKNKWGNQNDGTLVVDAASTTNIIDVDLDGSTSTIDTADSTPVAAQFTSRLSYDGQTANFSVGTKITGGTSGTTGIIEVDSDAGLNGYLYLSQASGYFADNETITGSGGGVALVNGPSMIVTINEYVDIESLQMDQYGSGYFTATCGSPLNPRGQVQQCIEANNGHAWITGCSGLLYNRDHGTYYAQACLESPDNPTDLLINTSTLGAQSGVGLPGTRTDFELYYDNQTANFSVGSTVTGGTSGATGVIESDDDQGDWGQLGLGETTNIFVDNETLTDDSPGSGSALAFGSSTGPYIGDLSPATSAVYQDAILDRTGVAEIPTLKAIRYQLLIGDSLTHVWDDVALANCDIDNEVFTTQLTYPHNSRTEDLVIPSACASILKVDTPYYWKIRFLEDTDSSDTTNTGDLWGLWSETNQFYITKGGSIVVGDCSAGTLSIDLGNTQNPFPYDDYILLPNNKFDKESCDISLETTAATEIHVMKNQVLTHETYTGAGDTLTDMPADSTAALDDNVGFYISDDIGITVSNDVASPNGNGLPFTTAWHQLKTDPSTSIISNNLAAVAAGSFKFWFGADVSLDTIAGVYSAGATITLVDPNP